MDPNQSFSPEEMQMLMELIMQGQSAGPEQDSIKRQFAQADAMRGSAPEMRQGGRVQTAPHWLELLGGLAGDVSGHMIRGKAETRQKDLGASTAQQNQKLLEMLMKMQTRPPPQPQPMASQPMGGNPGQAMGGGLRPPAPQQPGMLPPFQM